MTPLVECKTVMVPSSAQDHTSLALYKSMKISFEIERSISTERSGNEEEAVEKGEEEE
tara:strand:- start:2022 stop:2195 length:174 start_codon:yes stop_codon:yes gene_type:complete